MKSDYVIGGVTVVIERRSRAITKFLQTNPGIIADLTARAERVAREANSNDAGYEFRTNQWVAPSPRTGRFIAQVEGKGASRYRRNWPQVLLAALDAAK
jgi:hypothetical protein